MGVLRRLNTQAYAQGKRAAYPHWNGFVSELPLIAEFCVRNGATNAFLGALDRIASSPACIVLLIHLADMIRLNFTIFSDSEYDQISRCVLDLRKNADLQYRQSRLGIEYLKGTTVTLSQLFIDIRQFAERVSEDCRKAQYFYLKGSLLEGLNIEINQDKEAVQGYLSGFRFTATLGKSLDEAERNYHEAGDAFSLKTSMGHLRSFLEGLHTEAFPILIARFGGSAPAKWGEGLAFLRPNAVLSLPEERFVADLYTIISDEAVHPLATERGYARLFRNVVIEYALLFLWKLEKLGLKPGDERLAKNP
jgi:hypothetical protein